jgi:putative transcriptional regulator
MSDTSKSVGSELVDRLQRFTETLKTVESSADLPKILTVRNIKLTLRPQVFSADEVKTIRKTLNVSQAVFAEFLGVSSATVQDWEQGIKTPSGPACRLMNEITLNTPSWSRRIRELADVTADC